MTNAALVSDDGPGDDWRMVKLSRGLDVSGKTIASPLCLYSAPCPNAGRAILGPPRKFADCVNRSITCQTCGATGEESIGTDRVSRKPYRDLKLNKR